MQAALILQQVAVEAPPLHLARATADGFRSLASSLGVPAGDSFLVLFDAVLDRMLAAGMASWIVDYVAVVCVDAVLSSDDPGSAHLLREDAVAAWCARTTATQERRLHDLLNSAGGPQEGPDGESAALAAVGAAAEALLQVAGALRAPLEHASRPDLAALPERLQLLQQAARAAAYCRSAGVALQAPPPAYASRAVWQAAIAGRRAHQAGGRIFLDDLLDSQQAQAAHTGQAAHATRAAAAAASAAPSPAGGYPWATPAAAIVALFLGGGAGAAGQGARQLGTQRQAEAARRARLALLFYHLADGGWGPRPGAAGGSSCVTAAGFARAFGLPQGLATQWEAQQLLDRAGGGEGGGGAHLSRACELLLGCANAGTPFRVVEALAAAGRPAQALAVQRARGVGGGGVRGGGGGGGGLHEQRVLLAARLECALLQEAHAALRAHCSQLAAHVRAAHLETLMWQLLDWAGARDDEARRRAAASESESASVEPCWLQRALQLPLGSDEEEALAAWLALRAEKGLADGNLLPLFLLQRGRSLEALVAYAESRHTMTVAAAAPGEASTARETQLVSLLASAAAALPPALRGAALPPAAGATKGAAGGPTSGAPRRLLAGLPDVGAERAGSVASLVLLPRGGEPPVFLAPVVPPDEPGGISEDAGGSGAAIYHAGAAAPAAAGARDATEAAGATPVSGAAAASTADAGDAAPPAPATLQTSGLLFGVAAAPGGTLFGAPASAAPAEAGRTMSEADFRQQLLGLGPGAGASRSTRSATKRQRF